MSGMPAAGDQTKHRHAENWSLRITFMKYYDPFIRLLLSTSQSGMGGGYVAASGAERCSTWRGVQGVCFRLARGAWSGHHRSHPWRSEARRVGKECVSMDRSSGCTDQ